MHVVAGIHGWGCHETFGLLYWLADLVQPTREFELGAAQLIVGVRTPVNFQRLRPNDEHKKQHEEVFHWIVTKGCPGMLQIEPTGQAESTEAIVLANSKASLSEIAPLGMI